MYNFKKREIAFEQIEADKTSYVLEKFDYIGEYINQGFYKGSERGGTLVLTLIYEGKNGKRRFLEKIRDIRDVTFVADELEYDCKLESVSMKTKATDLFVATLRYQCGVWGRWQEVIVKPGLKALAIDSPLQTPIVIEAELADNAPENNRFRINGLLFSAEDRNKKIIIDSLNVKVENTRILDSFDLFYWQGITPVTTENLKNVKISWRKAYAAME